MAPRLPRMLPAFVALTVALGAAFALPGCASNDAALKTAERRATLAEATRDAALQRVASLEAQLAANTATTAAKPVVNDESSITPPSDKRVGKQTRQFTYLNIVHRLDAQQTEIVADYARFFTGADAVKVAEQAGKQPGKGSTFVLNSNHRLRTLPVDPSASITSIRGAYKSPGSPATWNLSEFIANWQAAPADAPIRTVPYWITVEYGRVVAIDEQYVP